MQASMAVRTATIRPLLAACCHTPGAPASAALLGPDMGSLPAGGDGTSCCGRHCSASCPVCCGSASCPAGSGKSTTKPSPACAPCKPAQLPLLLHLFLPAAAPARSCSAVLLGDCLASEGALLRAGVAEPRVRGHWHKVQQAAAGEHVDVRAARSGGPAGAAAPAAQQPRASGGPGLWKLRHPRRGAEPRRAAAGHRWRQPQ